MKNVLFLIVCTCSIHFADVMYEMVTLTKGLPGMDDVSTGIKVSIKTDRSRDELIINDPLTGKRKIVHITRLDKGVKWTLDTQNMRYSETAFISTPAPELEQLDMNTMAEVIVETTENTKEILRSTCEEVIVSVLVEGDTIPMVSQQMWVSSDFEGYEEIDSYFNKLIESGIDSPLSPVMGSEAGYMREFLDAIQSLEGFPLEATMYMLVGPDAAPYVIEIHSLTKEIATDPLDDSLFEIPTGYTLRK